MVASHFLDTKCSPHPYSTISTSLFGKPTHTNCLVQSSNNPISTKKQSSRPSLTEQEMFLPPIKSWLKKGTNFTEYYSKTAIQIGSSEIQKRNQQFVLKILILAQKSKYLHLCPICPWPQQGIQKNFLTYQCTGHFQRNQCP